MILGHTVFGDGEEKVIVMHDWLGDSTNYAQILPYLDIATFTYIFADFRGYGQSKKILGQFTCKEAATDIIALANHLNLESFHLIGHSMGGMVAERIALDAPGRVDSIIAITPVSSAGLGMPDNVIEFVGQMLATHAGRKQLMLKQWGDRLSDQWVNFKIRRWADVSDPAAVLGYLTMYGQTNFSQEIKDAGVPLLVICGEFDTEHFSEPVLKNIYSDIYSNVEFEMCDNSGHYPMQETPVYLATLIDRFLKKHI